LWIVRVASTIVVLAAAASVSQCKPPERRTEGWHPPFLDDPPPLGDGVEVEAVAGTPVDPVHLEWRFEGEGFGYEMTNRVRIDVQGGGPGSVDVETRGRVAFEPTAGGRARVVMTSGLSSGMGAPHSREYTMEPDGELLEGHPPSQALLDHIFPTSDEPLAVGEKHAFETVVGGEEADARVRATTALGIVGFAKVNGTPCAVVAMEHDARTFEKADGGWNDTGSHTHIELVGYFDHERRRYVAVGLREHSVTINDRGRRTTDRSASYVLEPSG
jgi:hypothetical protein